MVTIVKETNGKDETHFRFFEWVELLLMGMANGWRSSGKERMVFDEDNSKQFYAALESGLSEIEDQLLPEPVPGEPICPRLYMADVMKRNQLEVTEDFPEFCDGQPFRVSVDD
jgi:hypothetical protein